METLHLFLSALLAAAQPSQQDFELLLVDEEVFRGRVIRVLAGDTVEVWGQQEKYRVRLRGVGGLPDGHPQRVEAVELLSRLLLEGIAEVRAVPDPQSSEPDHLVATILVNGANASRELLAHGLAPYCPPPGGDRELEAAEMSARDRGIGIWSGTAPRLESGWDSCRERRPAAPRGDHFGP